MPPSASSSCSQPLPLRVYLPLPQNTELSLLCHTPLLRDLLSLTESPLHVSLLLSTLPIPWPLGNNIWKVLLSHNETYSPMGCKACICRELLIFPTMPIKLMEYNSLSSRLITLYNHTTITIRRSSENSLSLSLFLCVSISVYLSLSSPHGVSLCSSGWSRAYNVDQVGLELTEAGHILICTYNMHIR